MLMGKLCKSSFLSLSKLNSTTQHMNSYFATENRRKFLRTSDNETNDRGRGGYHYRYSDTYSYRVHLVIYVFYVYGLHY